MPRDHPRSSVTDLSCGYRDGFVTFEIGGQRCPIAAPMYPAPPHRGVERYVARYVVVKK